MPNLWTAVTEAAASVVRFAFRSWLWFFVRLALAAFFLGRLFAKHAASFNPEIIDAQDPVAFLVVVRRARRMGCPVVLTLHGYFHHESNWGSIPAGSFWGDVLKHIEKRAYMRASMIITVDSRLSQYVHRFGIDARRVFVRQNFVDGDTFKPSSNENRDTARLEFGLVSGQKAISCARRLERKSGVEYAVRAVKILFERGTDVVLFVAGRGSLERVLRDLVADLGLEKRVRFLGNLPPAEIANLLAASDAAIIPSVTVGEEVEATSIFALESMAAGVPVVASSIGGLEEIITDKENGLLVPERDVNAIADALQIAFSDRGRQLAENARSRVLEKFSIERGLRDTLEMYSIAATAIPNYHVRGHAQPGSSER